MADAGEFPSYNKKPHFFKVFFPQLSSERLVVPPAFWKHIKCQSPGTVCLTGPSGNIWQADLIESKCGIFFQKGWEEFVGDHSLQIGDFLVFRYDGNLSFTVLIFDVSACEKNEAFHATSSQEVVYLGMKNTMASTQENFVEILNDSSPGETGQVATICKGVNDSCLALDRPSLKRPFSSIESSANTRHQTCANNRLENVEEVSAMSLPIKPIRSLGGSVEKKPLIHANHLILDSVLRPIPLTKLAVISRCSGTSKLQKRHAPVSSHKTPRERLGWKTGRHSELPTRQSLQKNPVSSGNRSLSKLSCQLNLLPLTRKWSGLNSRCHRARFSTRIGTLLSQRRPITKEETDRAFRLANSFKSENPFSVIVMRESYVYHGFYLVEARAGYFEQQIPVSFVRPYLPKVSKEIKLWDPSGRSWMVNYISYYSYGGLSGGWGSFSFENNLEEDDACVFELVDKNKQDELRVHIFRVVEEITPLISKPRKIKSELTLY